MATLPAVKRTGSRNGQAAECRTGKAQPAPVSPGGFAADGFLKHQFLPLYQPEHQMPEREKVEKGLLKSLSILAGAHTLELPDVSGKPYPYNVLLAYWHARQQFGSREEIRLSMVIDDNGKALFRTTEIADTGQTLYYIPVIPLYRMLRDRRMRNSGELLLSVCSYLCRMVGVPYYREKDSYLYWHYEMLADWIENDRDDTEEYRLHQSDLNKAKHFGDIMGRQLHHPYQLAHFEQRIRQFAPRTAQDHRCLKIATDAYRLWQDYPGSNLFTHIVYNDSEDACEEEPPIRIDEYVSFIAETQGRLYDSLADMVNSDFNEKTAMDEPMMERFYDRSYRAGGNLDFERRLFDLLGNLCEQLNDIP